MRKRFFAILLICLCLFSHTALAGEHAAKYVFLFIADGQSLAQITATQYYMQQVHPEKTPLCFTTFPTVGLMTTYDLTSLCPDSAACATAMATGEKTASGAVNVAPDGSTLTPISFFAKLKGYRIGVATTAPINHATPAAFYSQVSTRKAYKQIALQGLHGGILDYLGGGGFYGCEAEAMQTVAQKMNWRILTAADARASISPSTRPTLLCSDALCADQSMQFEIDRLREQDTTGTAGLRLTDLVRAGIASMGEEEPFFFMVEGGKVDYAGHANDVVTSIWETIAFDEAVAEAERFAAEHREDTLIVVTSDHETGGLSVGYAGSAYDTQLPYLRQQSCSYAAFNEVVKQLRKENASFETAMKAVTEWIGLTLSSGRKLSLRSIEEKQLREAYSMSMLSPKSRDYQTQQRLDYGDFEPLTVTALRILAHKAGLAYSSYSHTAIQVPVYAKGVGSTAFQGCYDNTDLFDKLMDAMGCKTALE